MIRKYAHQKIQIDFYVFYLKFAFDDVTFFSRRLSTISILLILLMLLILLLILLMTFRFVSYELLVVVFIVPFVRLPLRCERSTLLLLLLLLLLFDCPLFPIGDEAIRLLMPSSSTVKLSPKLLSSSEFGVVFELHFFFFVNETIRNVCVII